MTSYTNSWPPHAAARPVEIASEREGLLADLAHHRDTLRRCSHGLTHEQATATPTVSGLSLAGVIKHAAHTERRWIAGTVGQHELPDRERRAGFCLEAGETLADVIGFSTSVAEDTEAIVAGVGDLDGRVWVPSDLLPLGASATTGHWSVRTVLIHVIEETGNHARAAGIVRQILDRGVRHLQPNHLLQEA